MKKFLLLLAVLAVGTGYVRGSPQYSYYRLRGALEAGDVATVEEHLDLSAVSSLAVDLLTATTAAAAHDAGGGALGGLLVTALAEAFGPALKGALVPAGADELKKRIAAKEFAKRVLDFEFASTFDGVSSIQRLDQSALLDLNGHCGSKSAKLRLVMEKKGGPLGGLLANWRVTGVDKVSLPAFVEACVTPALAK